MAASPWWVISTSTLNGQPWQAITFQGDRSAAQSASQGGILAGPFSSNAAAAAWGNAWSAREHKMFTNDPGVSSGNPVTGVTAGAGQLWNSLNNATGINAVGEFVKMLADPKLWVRIIKILLGGALLVTGIVRMSGADKTVMQVAKGALV